MRKLIFILIPLLLTGCSVSQSQNVTPGTQQHLVLDKQVTKTVHSSYLLFLPAQYNQKDQWPLIFFIHGGGEKGLDIEKVKTHGPPKIVQDKPDFPFIVLAPQCPPDDSWTERTETLVTLLDHIIDKYKVDPDRVYLTGMSMGGYGSWKLAADYPEKFAAVVPICGGGYTRWARRLKDTPIWAFHGAKDQAVPLARSEEMVQAVKDAGGNVQLTVYPGAGHDSWTRTYKNPKLYDWLLEYKRPQ